MLPNAGGLVTTQDGAKITFLMQGRTVFGENAKGERVGGQNIVMWFEADDERYKWLNDAMCVVEESSPAWARSASVCSNA